MPPEAMSAQDRWIDIAMTTYEGSSQLCGFCEGLFHVKLDFQRDGIYTLMGRTSEESKPCQSVKDFKKAVSKSRALKSQSPNFLRTIRLQIRYSTPQPTLTTIAPFALETCWIRKFLLS